MNYNTNVVFPMLGSATRFTSAGHWLTKPLLKARGKTLIEHAVHSLNVRGRHIFIIREMDDLRFAFGRFLWDTFPGATVIKVNKPTEGAVCSVLMASRFIDNNDPLFIASCDQITSFNQRQFYNKIYNYRADAAYITFRNNDPKWSYCRLDDEGLVAEVAEKRPISNRANTGVYWYAKGKHFVDAAYQLMKREDWRVNNEWFVSTVAAPMLEDGARIIDFECSNMVPLGVPSDLEAYDK
jgi:dTDP-glucose pyrophosphorylase